MISTFKRAAWVLGTAGMVFIQGCGGQNNSVATAPATTTTATSTTLTGTAAIGAPISGVVVAIDKNGKMSPAATTTALGAFIVDVSDMVAPFILNIVGTAGGSPVVLNSIATAAGQTVNITPLTDLIVSTASGQPGGESLAALCAPVANVAPDACLSALAAAATPANLASALDAVTAMIAPLNTGNVNPLTGSFVADGTGLDKVLDQILVSPALNQGAMATITLVATNTSLGTVTLPANAGETSTTATAPAPTQTQIDAANAITTAAATAMPEIRACMASFNALYAAPFTAPTSQRVAEFVTTDFQLGTQTYASFLSNFSGTNATQDFSLNVMAVSIGDMSPFSLSELASLNTAINVVEPPIHQEGRTLFDARTTTAIDLTSTINTAYVKIRPNNDPGVVNLKMVRGAAYAGCPGGWKMLGTQHIDMHMNARINRAADGAITREWAMHVAYSDVTALGGNRVKVGGPGLSRYDSSAANGVLEAATVDLVATQIQGNPSPNSMTLANLGTAYFSGTDAIKSCQDLKAAGVVGATVNDANYGIPCMDESKAGPGKTYMWYVLDRAVVGQVTSFTAKAAFPFQTSAVPISKAFALANAADIFANITSYTPASVSAYPPNTDLTNQITLNYSTGTAYKARAEHCGVNVFGGGLILAGEQEIKGNATTCTFDAPYSVTSTFGAFGFSATPTAAVLRVANTVLGNQAVGSILIPQ